MGNAARNISPFSVTPARVERGETRDPNGAVEVTPIVLFGSLGLFEASEGKDFRALSATGRAGVNDQAEEAKASADTDPKAACSSVTDSASHSSDDTQQNGNEETSPDLTHPSLITATQETPVTAEKDQSLNLPFA